MYSGTIGSGKSYHALEDIVAHLEKGKYVIANFPLKFTSGQIRRGLADRFMYMSDDNLMGVAGISSLMKISQDAGWFDQDQEGICLCVIDEATNYFPKEDATKPEQRLWRTFFTQSRKFSYDFILIVQDDQSLNKTINKCIEYDVKHRKINNIFPFKFLPFTIFMYITYWKQQRTKLSSNSSIFVKKFASMYKTKRLFGNLDQQLNEFIAEAKLEVKTPEFGNCREEEQLPDLRTGGAPLGEAPDSGSAAAVT